MNLIIDIGNSSCKAALFDGTTLLQIHKGSNRRIEILDRWCAEYSIDRAIISSVIELTDEIVAQLQALPCSCVRFSTSMPLPVKLLYKTPETLGVDRLAAVIGAQAEAPGKDILVIDAGSAITYDFLDAQGNYHGGKGFAKSSQCTARYFQRTRTEIRYSKVEKSYHAVLNCLCGVLDVQTQKASAEGNHKKTEYYARYCGA